MAINIPTEATLPSVLKPIQPASVLSIPSLAALQRSLRDTAKPTAHIISSGSGANSPVVSTFDSMSNPPPRSNPMSVSSMLSPVGPGREPARDAVLANPYVAPPQAPATVPTPPPPSSTLYNGSYNSDHNRSLPHPHIGKSDRDPFQSVHSRSESSKESKEGAGRESREPRERESRDREREKDNWPLSDSHPVQKPKDQQDGPITGPSGVYNAGYGWTQTHVAGPSAAASNSSTPAGLASQSRISHTMPYNYQTPHSGAYHPHPPQFEEKSTPKNNESNISKRPRPEYASPTRSQPTNVAAQQQTTPAGYPLPYNSNNSSSNNHAQPHNHSHGHSHHTHTHNHVIHGHAHSHSQPNHVHPRSHEQHHHHHHHAHSSTISTPSYGYSHSSLAHSNADMRDGKDHNVKPSKMPKLVPSAPSMKQRTVPLFTAEEMRKESINSQVVNIDNSSVWDWLQKFGGGSEYIKFPERKAGEVKDAKPEDKAVQKEGESKNDAQKEVSDPLKDKSEEKEPAKEADKVPAKEVLQSNTEIKAKPKIKTKTKIKPKPIPFLGRFIFDANTPTDKLLDGQLLLHNLGGRLEIVIHESLLLDAKCKWELGSPQEYQGQSLLGSQDETDLGLTPEMWDKFPGLKDRKVWGTDVYTDDSDLLGVLIHSGWLRVQPQRERGDVTMGEEDSKKKEIVMKMRVVPGLVRYQSTTRQGLKSRSWGNSHDGVSLLVEAATVVEVDRRTTPKGRKNLKKRSRAYAAQFTQLDSLPCRIPLYEDAAPGAPQTRRDVGGCFIIGAKEGQGGFVWSQGSGSEGGSAMSVMS